MRIVGGAITNRPAGIAFAFRQQVGSRWPPSGTLATRKVTARRPVNSTPISARVLFDAQTVDAEGTFACDTTCNGSAGYAPQQEAFADGSSGRRVPDATPLSTRRG